MCDPLRWDAAADQRLADMLVRVSSGPHFAAKAIARLGQVGCQQLPAPCQHIPAPCQHIPAAPQRPRDACQHPLVRLPGIRPVDPILAWCVASP
ncbi:hypothetical protein [Sorangium sp. So ce204]|uniref:hypothetical protein n=1 Tax=Sorangium sp. So ce204 TaxID=3133288 RepID=UPI003F616ED8